MNDRADRHGSDGSIPLMDSLPGAALISFVRVETVGGHDRIQIWNKGRLAGTLLVCLGDGEAIADLLRSPAPVPLEASTVEAINATLREMLTPAELAQLLELLTLREL